MDSFQVLVILSIIRGVTKIPNLLQFVPHFTGAQYRTQTCHWGGNLCMNTTEDVEMLPYCNGHDIELCPLGPDKEFGTFVIRHNRTLRSSPSYCMEVTNLEPMIEQCDHGQTAWTHWLEWGIDAQNDHLVQRSRRRYCSLKSEDCLFEEKTTQECCKCENCSATNLPECDFCPLS